MWGDAHPGAKSYIAGHKLWVVQETGGTTYTLSGRSRTDKGVFSQNGEISSSAHRALVSAHIQGSAADIVKEAMLQLDELYTTMYPTAHILLQVHDEVISETDPDLAPEIAKKKQYIMENAWKLNNVPLVADPAIGKSWADKA
jgi:DNA polymerase-1